MYKPEPIDKEIEIDPKRYLISETDVSGKIISSNAYFQQVSGYSEEELKGSPHSIIRHPDMPKVVFKLLWESISKGNNINAVIKNLAKDGRYYWVFTEFESKNDQSGNIISYTAHRKKVSKHIIDIVADLYAKLLEIEQNSNVEGSENYLVDFLNKRGDSMTFTDFMENIHKFY